MVRDKRFISPEYIEKFAEKDPYAEDPWSQKREQLWGTKRNQPNTITNVQDWIWLRVKEPRIWVLSLNIHGPTPAEIAPLQPFWEVRFGSANGATIWNFFDGVHTIFGDSVTVRTPSANLVGLSNAIFIAFAAPGEGNPSWVGQFVR